jgi:hypothetical protein
MSFEIDTLHVVSPLDPYEGYRYNDPINEEAWILVIKNIYKITRCNDDYINPTVDGELSWRSVKSYDTVLNMPWKVLVQLYG